MKLPRDISGSELASALESCGYEVVRQTGSHLRLVCRVRGVEHKITIPRHSPLKVGTLSAILSDVAEYLRTDKQELLKRLFE